MVLRLLPAIPPQNLEELGMRPDQYATFPEIPTQYLRADPGHLAKVNNVVSDSYR